MFTFMFSDRLTPMKKRGRVLCLLCEGLKTRLLSRVFNQKYILKDPCLQRDHLGSPSFQVRGAEARMLSAEGRNIGPLHSWALSPQGGSGQSKECPVTATVAAEPSLACTRLLSAFLQGASLVGNQTQRLLNPFNHVLSTNHEGRGGGGRNTDEEAIFE